MRTIKGKMLLWFGSIIILVLVLLGIILSDLVQNAVIPAIQESGEQIVSANAKEIGHWVQTYAEYITNVSKLRVFREGSLEEIQSYLASHEEEENPDFELLFYANENGDYYSKEGYLGNISFREYFQRLMKGEADAIVTNALISNSSGKFIFVIAHSVQAQSAESSGKPRGIVAATISLDTLSIIANRVRLDDGGYGWVTDGTGLVIAHPDPEMRMKFNVAESHAQNFKGLDITGQHMMSGLSGIGSYINADGTELIIIYHPIPNTPNWSLALSIPKKDWMRKADLLSRRILLLMIGILAIIAVLITLLSNHISRPLSLAVSHLNTISKGDFTRHIPEKYRRGRGEISDLANGIESMQNAIESLMERMQFLAYNDVLTGLPNRIKLIETIDMYDKDKEKLSPHLGLLLLDIDNFKDVNDTMGHYLGNKLLLCLSDIIQKVVSKSTSKYRLFKHEVDQFLILVQNISDRSELEKLASEISQALEEPIGINEHEFFVTVSIGGAFYPEHGTTGELLVQKADMAMTVSKNNGKNRYTLYEDSMNQKIIMRLDMQKSLRKGLARREFMLVYQPIVQAGTDKVIAVEALLRWNHPNKGMIPPMEFIPLAEESGLIDSIGEWVLREACWQNKEWQDKGLPPINVSVNVSARQLQKKDFVPRLRRILEETGLQPQYLTLELTESVFMGFRNASFSVLESLQNMGIKVAIDDFGTGYSSLSYLKNLPVNILKMDKSFAYDIEAGQERTLADSIILLGHKLNLDVIAEGIESASQAHCLTAWGCDYLQGYFFSKPMTAHTMEKVLAADHIDKKYMDI